MSAQTFEETVTVATQIHDEGLAMKQTLFAEPLKELAKLRTEWEKLRPQFQERLNRVLHRAQQAMKAGVDARHVMNLVERHQQALSGGLQGQAGLLSSLGPQIDSAIEQMNQFDPKLFHARHLWIAMPTAPSRVRDNIHAVEERLGWLEDVVKDGGPLQGLIEEAIARKTGQESGPEGQQG